MTWLSLQSEALSAQIDPQGAQLSVLRDGDGRDLLWNGDPAFWASRAPLLFPIVGELSGGQYGWRGQRYALGRHGFARGRRFQVVRHDEKEALLRLTADAETAKIYPFSFELDASFRAAGAVLSMQLTVRNTGHEPLPASLGFHPALRWPLPDGGARGDHAIEFESEEGALIRRLDPKGLLLPEGRPTPVRGRRLVLDDALFREDVIIFDAPRSRRLVYGGSSGPRIAVTFPDATHLGLWTKPGAGFICIEPWRGVADQQGFSQDLDCKPGIFLVAPGAAQSLTMQIGIQ